MVSTAVGGVPDVITHGHTGLLVPDSDAGELARALGRLVRDPALGSALGLVAQRHVLARDDATRLVRDVDSLYASLLKRAGVTT